MTTTALQRIRYNGNAAINLNWPERYISIAAGVKLSFSGIRNIFKSPFTSILKQDAVARGIRSFRHKRYAIGSKVY